MKLTQFKKLLNLFVFVCPVLLLAQNTDIKNVSFEAMGYDIIIHYQLDGDLDEEYLISCYLKSESDENFKYKLRYADGDIGQGNYVGTHRKIVWHYKKEFPIGLSGDDFYFSVTVDNISSGIAWYYYLGAAVAGGTAAYMLSTNPDSKSTSKNNYADFPLRP